MATPDLHPAPNDLAEPLNLADLSKVQLERKRERGHFIAGMGLLLMLSPVIGFIFTFNAMMSDHPDEISRGIGLSLKVSLWGFGAALLGSALLMIAVMALGNRQLWVYRNGLFLAVLMCLTYGALGVIFGLAIITVLLIRRSEFLRAKTHPK